MGLVNSTIRVKLLMSQKFDYEQKQLSITQALTTLAGAITELEAVGNDYTDPNNPVLKTINERVKKLNYLEKRLQGQLKQYELRIKEIDAELQSAVQMRDKWIETSFKYGGR